MRIIVTGLIGQYAFGGVTWDYIQYVLGFRELGHDVWYLEDTANWAYNPVEQQATAECFHNVNYIDRVMRDFNLGDRWIYRNEADGKYHGVNDTVEAEKIISGADVLVNVSGACWLRPVTASIKTKLYLDGDPMFTQIGLATESDPELVSRVRAHDRHYSFGLNIGGKDCKVPTAGLVWRPTIQPVALSWWNPDKIERDPSHPVLNAWSTVMNWASYKPRIFEGETYGQKDIEFMKFVDLPLRTSERFVLGMGQGLGQNRPTEMLESKNWTILEPSIHLPDYESYWKFLAHSKAEWSIAKNGYVKSRSGWFSCRSACYLALGKPVVVQDTGWSEHLPSGEGVLPFTTLDDAADSINAIAADYERHSQAATAFARKHLDAAKVCADLLEA